MGNELWSTLSIEDMPYESEALNGVTHEFRGWMVGEGGSGIVALYQGRGSESRVRA